MSRNLRFYLLHKRMDAIMVNVNKIKYLAKVKGLKLGKLASDFGEDSTYFSKVKSGLRRMDDNRIQYAAEYLGTTFEYLTDQSDDPFPPTPFSSDPTSFRRIPVFSFDRFRERCVAKGITVGYAESRLNLEQGAIDTAEGNGNVPGDDLVKEMAILLDTTPEYLLCLTDDPRVPLDDKTGVKIKVFGEVAAGIPIQQIDNFDPDDANSWEEINRKTARSGIYFALRIKGQSMYPEIKDGAVVIVRKQDDVESGELAVVAINGDTATCKKVVKDENGIYLMPINPAFPPQFFSSEQIQELPVRILGKVVEARNKY